MRPEQPLALNPINNVLNAALNAASSALQALNNQGATVLSIEIRNARPIIKIDGQHGRFLQGSMKTRRSQRGMHRLVLVASVNGCQVEWDEIYPVAREALPA